MTVKVETIDLHIDAIKPYWRNAKKGTNTDMLKESIQKYWYTSYIVVDKEYTIIAWHSRYKALRELGYTDIKVNVVDISNQEAKKLRLLDNKIAEQNEWDFEKLWIEMRELNDEFLWMVFDMNLDNFEAWFKDLQVGTQDLSNAQEKLDNITNKVQIDTQQKVTCPYCTEDFFIEK